VISFSTKILRFAKKGEKTGWSYIEISRKHIEQLNPGAKKSFRVKGQLDQHSIEKVAVLPMGDGEFILPINGSMRKAIGKEAGDTMKVKLEIDNQKIKISNELMQCLKDEPRAHDFFKTLPKGHQNYFSNWIESAKTTPTKTKRITMAVIALAQGLGFGEMIRANKSKPE
jgi:hypothetical protein